MGWLNKVEKIETIYYNPELRDTGDLESGTKTITATSKPGAADYSKVMSMAKPSDIRMLIKVIGARLSVTRDSGTSSNLYCSVYVDDADGSEADHCLFDGVDVQAGSLQVQNVLVGTKEVLFNLLKDGSTHTFYFFFWCDSGNSVISLVELWYGVGATGASHCFVLTVGHTGLMMFGMHRGGIGSGTMRTDIHGTIDRTGYHSMLVAQSSATILGFGSAGLLLTTDGVAVDLWGTVATDLILIRQVQVMLRSEL
ncbi:MAG TPA: hypothetical protein G4N93_03895 [Dehalococcoidia bacterium]|nr:hypothetical protein [Dehalococcoidia bacterium]